MKHIRPTLLMAVIHNSAKCYVMYPWVLIIVCWVKSMTRNGIRLSASEFSLMGKRRKTLDYNTVVAWWHAGCQWCVWYYRWHHPFVIGWPNYRLGIPSAPLNYGLTWPVGIPIVFQTLVTVPLHSPNGRQMPVVRAVQGDRDRVTENTGYII